jgi:hypothetical protein
VAAAGALFACQVWDLRTAARAALIVAAVLAGLVLSACGASSTGDPAQLSRAEFIRQGDRICDQAHQHAYKVSTQVQKLVAAKQGGEVSEHAYRFRISRLTNTYSKIADHSAREMAQLGAPAGNDRGLQRYLNAVEAESKLFFRQAGALADGNAKQVRALSFQTLQLGAQTRQLAHSLGFHTCGGG